MENENEILKKVLEEGVSWTHGQGYDWFHKTLLPIVDSCVIADETLLSDCWYVIGDVYDFNDAPKMAISAYQKSIHYDLEHAEAYRELASMYERIGEYRNAFEAINKAIEYDPDDKFSKDDLESIFQELKDPGEPFYSEGDLEWQCNELLAKNKPNEVISLLTNKRKIGYRKIRARSLGILKELDRYFYEWKMIVKNNLQIEFTYADWFYMPSEIYYKSEFWKLLYENNSLMISGVLPDYSTLYKNYKTSIDSSQMRKLVIESFILKNENNEQGLKKIAEKYPEWKELKDMINDKEWGKSF